MAEPRDKRAKIRVGRHSIPMPGTRRRRMILGSGLVAGGLLGILPIVGFWMLPLGLVVLSVDSPAVRRARRRLEIRWGRWREVKRAASAKRKGRE